MQRILFAWLSLVISLYVHSQFHYQLVSDPDSSIVLFNGEQKCTTPCLLSYRWKDAMSGAITIQVMSPGYKTWSDTITSKPHEFTKRQSVELDREFVKVELDSGAAIIAFDRLLATDHQNGTTIGSFTDKDGKIEVIKWEGEAKIGEKAFERKFYEITKAMGFPIPKDPGPKLFDKNNSVKQQLPRYLIGAKLVDYNIAIAYDDSKDHGAGKITGRTTLGLEWQVLDRSTDQIVLVKNTSGLAKQRQRSSYDHGNLTAFENALIQFLQDEEFIALINSTKGFFSVNNSSGNSSVPPTIIHRPATPVMTGISDIIKFADKACVTIMTDGGHGSGVIISEAGYMLSAYHVVEGVNQIEVHFSDGLKQEAKILAFDRNNDVVLLDISGSGYHSLPIGSGNSTTLGEEVITIGTPAEISLGQSVARGILSGKRKINDLVYLQTDMSVSPGNSGGPLINAKGEVIGIVQGKMIGDGIEGIGFCIPIERALEGLHLQLADPKN